MPNFKVIDGRAQEAQKKSVVETLEELLFEAKEGYISAIAVAIVRPNNGMSNAWSNCEYGGHLLGSVTLLQSRLISSVGNGDAV